MDKWNGIGFSEERHCRILYNDIINVDGDSEFRILLLDKPLEGPFYPLQVIPQSNVLFHSGHISGMFCASRITSRGIRVLCRSASGEGHLGLSSEGHSHIRMLAVECSLYRHFFNNNYVMNSTDDSIRDAMMKIKSWILLDYNKIKVELVSSNQYYASSLMVQLFIRRVVEMSLIEGCYNKVGASFSSHM